MLFSYSTKVFVKQSGQNFLFYLCYDMTRGKHFIQKELLIGWLRVVFIYNSESI